MKNLDRILALGVVLGAVSFLACSKGGGGPTSPGGGGGATNHNPIVSVNTDKLKLDLGDMAAI
jgi:hypothetical protein